MGKKYRLTDETITVERDGKKVTLHRIEALRDFGNIKAGDKGGFVKSEKNLSHNGDCWIFGCAKVYGSAEVYSSAEVCGNAKVCGNAWISGRAKVYDNAWISGCAKVYGCAEVYGCAKVYSSAEVYGTTKVCGDTMLGVNSAPDKSTNKQHKKIK